MSYKLFLSLLPFLSLFGAIHHYQVNEEKFKKKKVLIDVTTIIPNIVIDLKYATNDNFVNEVVYDDSTCYLLEETTLALKNVQDELATLGLSLKIWDGYRPFAAQEKFWALLPDERYVSNPKKGGRHTRGTAVDLTIVDIDGEELPMPSPFDDFSERAHRNFMDATEEEIQNRNLLQTVMEKHGFIGLRTEWWHFDLKGWKNCPPIKNAQDGL